MNAGPVDRPKAPSGRASPAGRLSWKLIWICTPLPTPLGSRIGAKMARWPRRCARTRHITHDDGVVGAGDADRRLAGHLKLAGTVFRQEGIRLTPPGAAGDERLAKDALAAIGIEAIGRGRQLIDAAIHEFLLESGKELQAGDVLQRRQRPAQEIARAAGPGPPIGLADIAQEEMLGRDRAAKSTCTSVASSGTRIRSPVAPKGVSPMGPKQRSWCWWEPSRRPSQPRGGCRKALAATRPAISQVQTMRIGSRFIFLFPGCSCLPRPAAASAGP